MTGRLVNRRFVTGRFVTGRFVTGRFVTGRFVTGHFVNWLLYNWTFCGCTKVHRSLIGKREGSTHAQHFENKKGKD
jgi:hypothetical protein